MLEVVIYGLRILWPLSRFPDRRAFPKLGGGRALVGKQNGRKLVVGGLLSGGGFYSGFPGTTARAKNPRPEIPNLGMLHMSGISGWEV